MLVYRSITVGLLLACFLLLAQVRNESHHVHPRRMTFAPPVVSYAVDHARIVDVAPSVRDVLSLLTLSPGERITAVNDRPVRSDLEAGALIASSTDAGRFLDLTTTRGRVLVLMH